jgi:hypothetical protein
MTATATGTIDRIGELLGDEAGWLLEHESKTPFGRLLPFIRAREPRRIEGCHVRRSDPVRERS